MFISTNRQRRLLPILTDRLSGWIHLGTLGLACFIFMMASSVAWSADDAQSDDSTQQWEDDDDVEADPDQFVKRAAARRRQKKDKEQESKSTLFSTASSDDGAGVIGQLGHLAFKTFGRDYSISPVEALPYVLTDEHFIFGDVRGFVSNNSLFGGNAGVGYRNLREDLNSWFGGSVWYDADGTSGKNYQQIGLSFEAMVAWLEFRSNVYIPVTSSQSYSNSVSNARIVGNQLVYSQYIDQGKALTGVDFEAGYNVPVLTDNRFRGFVGYYHFDGGSGGPVNGFKARVEGVINNTVTAQVLYTNDRLFGSNIMVGCQLQFPWGNSHPSSGWRRNTPSPFRFVERNYNVIVDHSTTANGNLVAYNPVTHAAYKVEQVSSTAAPGGNGTTAHPFATVSAAQAAGADIILVQGNSVLTAPVVLSQGQRLIGDGSGQLVPIAGGGSLALPTIISGGQMPQFQGITGTAVTLASNSQVSGFTFSNINGNGITGNTVSSATISDVNFQNISGDAIRLTNSSGSIAINNVTINGTTGDGLRFTGGDADLTFSGTIKGTQQDGIALSNLTGGKININGTTISQTTGSGLVLNNVVTNVNVNSLSTSQTQGAAVSINGGTTANTYDFNNTTTIQTPSGVGFNVSGSQANINVDKLVVTSTAGSPAVQLANSAGKIVLSNLNVTTTNATGLAADTIGSLTISGGSVTTTNASAIDIKNSTIAATLSKVSVNGGPFGIRLVQDHGTFNVTGANAYASGGTIQNTQTGVILNNAGSVALSWLDLISNGVGIQSNNNNQVNLGGLRIGNSTGYAIDSLNDLVVVIESSQFASNGTVGGGTIRGQASTVGSYQWLIQGNTINDANGTPILLTTTPSGAGASLAASIQQNAITGTRGGTSMINVNWNGPLSLQVSTNTLAATASNMTGINVRDDSTTDSTVARITGNTMTFSDIQGTGVMVAAQGSNTYQVDNNTVTFNGVQGIGLRFNQQGTSTDWIYSNVITDKAGGATGMLWDNIAANSRVQIEANTITLLSSDLTVHRGIIFTSVTPTIQFAGNYNNVISNASTVFSIPVNSSSGHFYINGTLFP